MVDQPTTVEQENEPMLLLDTTGSMGFASSATDSTKRRDVIHEAIGLIVAELEKADSQAEHEEDAGGLRTVTFAGGSAKDIGDLNSQNLRSKWNQINWGGGTVIMPGFNLLLRTYTNEFGSKPQAERPHLLALVITDGEADDTDVFAENVARAAGNLSVVLAIIGFGPEHDRAVEAYRAVEAKNDHVKVIPFAGETDPSVIASALLNMM